MQVSAFDPVDRKAYLFPAVVETQYNDVINASDAWLASDEAHSNDHPRDLKPTVSSRRIKSLVEQVTGQFFFLFVFRFCAHCDFSETWFIIFLQIGTHTFHVPCKRHISLLRFSFRSWNHIILVFPHRWLHLKRFRPFLCDLFLELSVSGESL